MPEESVADYINNTITFVIFILICVVIFAIIYLVSLGIRNRVLSRNQSLPHKEIDEDRRGRSFTGISVSLVADLKTNPFMRKNLALIGMAFISTILFIIMALAVFYYSWNMEINIVLFLIGTVLFSLIVVLVYVFRSKIIN